MNYGIKLRWSKRMSCFNLIIKTQIWVQNFFFLLKPMLSQYKLYINTSIMKSSQTCNQYQTSVGCGSHNEANINRRVVCELTLWGGIPSRLHKYFSVCVKVDDGKCFLQLSAVPVVNQEVGHAECRLDRPIDTYSSIDIYIQHLQKNKKNKYSLSSKLFIIVIGVWPNEVKLTDDYCRKHLTFYMHVHTPLLVICPLGHPKLYWTLFIFTQ